jgi:hypothetical protein
MQDLEPQVTEAENQVLGKLARVLYSVQVEGTFQKDAWEAQRADYRRQARKMLRSLEKQGLTISLAS